MLFENKNVVTLVSVRFVKTKSGKDMPLATIADKTTYQTATFPIYDNNLDRLMDIAGEGRDFFSSVETDGKFSLLRLTEII